MGDTLSQFEKKIKDIKEQAVQDTAEGTAVMDLDVEDKGAVDLANNWSISGRIQHMEVRQDFLKDLKDEGLIITKWISRDEMSSDLFTKNMLGPLFAIHSKVYCRD